MNLMRNKLTDLNNHLFAQLERLSEEDLKGEELAVEITRSNAVTGVAREIISNAKVVLDAQKAFSDRVVGKPAPMLSVDTSEK